VNFDGDNDVLGYSTAALGTATILDDGDGGRCSTARGRRRAGATGRITGGEQRGGRNGGSVATYTVNGLSAGTYRVYVTCRYWATAAR